MKATSAAIALLALSLAACSASAHDDVTEAPPPSAHDTSGVPLSELGADSYLGFSGGLYDNGQNTPPAEHAAIGLDRARRVQPLGADGRPAADGKIVLLSVGMSNTSQEFCGVDVTVGCIPGSFRDRATTDPAVSSSLVVVNGAQGGRDAIAWTSASAPTFDTVRDRRLSVLGVTENQVQVIWLLQATKRPTTSLPAVSSDAYSLERNLGDIVRALHERYPHLQQVFISNRIYGGYATTQENPEPFAYETGFADKWLIQAQIQQMRAGGQIVDGRAGDLDYRSEAPWLAWGPDLWANGAGPRRDGLVWLPADFKSDGTHPSVESGVPKVGGLLFQFFSTSPFTSCWFLADRQCS